MLRINVELGTPANRNLRGPWRAHSTFLETSHYYSYRSPGLAPDRLLRCCVMKHLKGWSFRDLERELRSNLVYPHKMHAPGSSSSWQRCSSFRHCWEELPNITVLICRVSLELISDGFYPSMLSGHVTSRRCFLQRNRRRKFADDLVRDCVPRGEMTV
jgi:hypothetical protein